MTLVKSHVDKYSSVDEVVLREHYDVAFLGASWDNRCLLISKMSGVDIGAVWVGKFENPGVSGRSSLHLGLIRKFADGLGLEAEELQLDSGELVQSWLMVRSRVVALYRSLGRPVRILVDLSALPRFVTLGILAFGLRSNVVQSVTYVYGIAGGYVHDFPQVTGQDAYGFSEGSWRPLPVPGLSRGGTGHAPGHLIVSVGYDGAKLKKLVGVLEPDSLNIVLAGRPGEKLHDRAARENEQLALSFGQGRCETMSVSLEGVSEVRGLVRSWAERAAGGGSEVSIVLAGPKLHSLGFALAALDAKVANFFYIVPDSHRELFVDPIQAVIVAHCEVGFGAS